MAGSSRSLYITARYFIRPRKYNIISIFLNVIGYSFERAFIMVARPIHT